MREGRFTESDVEQAALAWLETLGYMLLSGPEIAPAQVQAERNDYGQVVLERRLRQALERLNPEVPADALEDTFRKLTRPHSPSLVANNHSFHRWLVQGVPVEYARAEGGMEEAAAAPKKKTPASLSALKRTARRRTVP